MNLFIGYNIGFDLNIINETNIKLFDKFNYNVFLKMNNFIQKYPEIWNYTHINYVEQNVNCNNFNNYSIGICYFQLFNINNKYSHIAFITYNSQKSNITYSFDNNFINGKIFQIFWIESYLKNNLNLKKHLNLVYKIESIVNFQNSIVFIAGIYKNQNITKNFKILTTL